MYVNVLTGFTEDNSGEDCLKCQANNGNCTTTDDGRLFCQCLHSDYTGVYCGEFLGVIHSRFPLLDLMMNLSSLMNMMKSSRYILSDWMNGKYQ